MSRDYCIECGHLLTKRGLRCSYCGWSEDDSKIPSDQYVPESTHEYSGIYYTDFNNIERIANVWDQNIFETY